MYTVELDEDAQGQVDSLPSDALAGYTELRKSLETSPWSGQTYDGRRPDAPLRVRTFAEWGMVAYLILEDQQRVDVLQVIWAG